MLGQGQAGNVGKGGGEGDMLFAIDGNSILTSKGPDQYCIGSICDSGRRVVPIEPGF